MDTAVTDRITPEIIEIKHAPFPGGQTDFLGCAAFEVLFGGQTGPGKTHTLMLDALGLQFKFTPLGKRAIDIPEYRAIIFRRKTTHLAKLIDEGKKLYTPLGAKFLHHRTGDPGPSFNFPHPDNPKEFGARIFLCHMENEMNKFDHDGQEYHFEGFDEVQQFSLSSYLYLHSRLRSTIPHLFTRIRATAMPVGSGLAWVKKRFDIKNAGMVRYWLGAENPESNPQGVETTVDNPDGRSRVFIPGYLEENTAVNKVEYRANVKGMGKRFERAMLENDWDAFSGDFFAEFDPSTEIIEPFEIPESWELVCSIDPAWAGTFSAGLCARDHTGVIYRISTYYQQRRNPEQNALGVLGWIVSNKFTGGRMPSVFVSGHDAWARKDRFSIQQSEATLADVFETHGMILTKAVTDRVNGWGTLRSLMPDKLFIFKGFNQPFLDELVALEHDPDNVEDIKGGGNDATVTDHACDEMRYNVMAIMIPPKPPEEKTDAERAGELFQKQMERERQLREGERDFHVGEFY